MVAALTDAHLSTVSGVAYTIQTWREQRYRRDGRMDMMSPANNDYDPEPGEHGIRGFPFPFYEGIRIGAPHISGAVDDVDVIHAHTPFGLELVRLRLARRHDIPLVATYYTLTGGYAEYLNSVGVTECGVEHTAEWYEQ